MAHDLEPERRVRPERGDDRIRQCRSTHSERGTRCQRNERHDGLHVAETTTIDPRTGRWEILSWNPMR